ncbi:MAG: hypothetical protein ABI625_06175 [bacterium]
MNPIITFFFIASVAASTVSPRYTELALACGSGCVSDDSLQVAAALRAGLAHEGVTVVQGRTARDNLPLLVSGRITVEGSTIRVSAELLEVDRAVSRYAVAVSRENLSAQVRRMGERFGRALFTP